MSVAIARLVLFFQSHRLIRTYKRGEVIIHQGDTPTNVYMVKKGMVKIYDIDANGNERTISIFNTHNIFPTIWLLKNPPSIHLYYEAFTDVSCYVGSLVDLRRYISTKPEIMVELLDILTRRHLNMYSRVENLEKSFVHERFEFVLYYLVRQLGEVKGNIGRIPAVITQKDIARLSGAARETISTEANKSKNKIFWCENGSTLVNLDLINIEEMPTLY